MTTSGFTDTSDVGVPVLTVILPTLPTTTSPTNTGEFDSRRRYSPIRRGKS